MSKLVPSIRSNDSIVPFENFIDSFFNWAPLYEVGTFKIDVAEEIKHYMVEAELPGVEKKDIDLDFHDGRLNISVNHTDEVDEKSKNYIHKERRTTSTQRSIYLDGATGEGITAALDNGILRIEVPKEGGGSRRKKIEIK